MSYNPDSIKKLLDTKFYLENFCKIKGKQPGSLVPFILNEAQKDLFNTVKKHSRVIILKARQIGFSTAMVGYFYHNTIMNPGTNTAIIGYNADLTAELLDKVKTFYRTTPISLRPTIKYDSKHEISFPRIDSKILVLPSTVNVGRGYTLHNVLATELSAWENADEKMMTLEASVPINGHLVIESTPRGVGNLYHRMWYADDNGYAKKEYGWWWGYKKEEIEMIRKRMNNPQKFAQEYGLEFLASGRAVFDAKVIAKHRRNILKVGDITVDDEDNKFTVMEDEGWRIYKPPRKDGIYVIGADVSEGVLGGDYSVAVIFDRKTGEEVAFFKKLVPPDRFGDILDRWGRKYNNALMTVEINNHGLTTMLVLKQKVYPNFYFRLARYETPGMPSSDKMGWKTTNVTRPLLIDDLAQSMRENALLIHSKEILDEMMVMVYDDNGNIVCMEGFHDDCVFATGVGFQGFKMVFDRKMSQLNYEDYLPKTFAY